MTIARGSIFYTDIHVAKGTSTLVPPKSRSPVHRQRVSSSLVVIEQTHPPSLAGKASGVWLFVTILEIAASPLPHTTELLGAGRVFCLRARRRDRRATRRQATRRPSPVWTVTALDDHGAYQSLFLPHRLQAGSFLEGGARVDLFWCSFVCNVGLAFTTALTTRPTRILGYQKQLLGCRREENGKHEP